MKLAEKLVHLRKEKRITQSELAEMMNVSRQAVSRWEVGDAAPSTENLKCLSKLYGISLEILLDEKESVLERPEISNITPKTQEQETKTSRGKLIIFIFAILLLATALIFATTNGKQDQQIPIEEMEEERVDTSTEGDFHFTWDE